MTVPQMPAEWAHRQGVCQSAYDNGKKTHPSGGSFIGWYAIYALIAGDPDPKLLELLRECWEQGAIDSGYVRPPPPSDTGRDWGTPMLIGTFAIVGAILWWQLSHRSFK